MAWHHHGVERASERSGDAERRWTDDPDDAMDGRASKMLRLLRSGAGVPAASVLLVKRSTGPGRYVKLQSVPVFALIGQLACERDDCRQFQ